MVKLLSLLLAWHEGPRVPLEPCVHERRRRLYYVRRSDPMIQPPWLPSVKARMYRIIWGADEIS